jgi:hypothetical protein
MCILLLIWDPAQGISNDEVQSDDKRWSLSQAQRTQLLQALKSCKTLKFPDHSCLSPAGEYNLRLGVLKVRLMWIWHEWFLLKGGAGAEAHFCSNIQRQTSVVRGPSIYRGSCCISGWKEYNGRSHMF